MQDIHTTPAQHQRITSFLPPPILNPIIPHKLLPLLILPPLPPIRPSRPHTLKTARTRIQLAPTTRHLITLPTSRLQFLRVGNGLVAPEALPHVDHAALALAIAVFELLALGGQGVGEGRAEAVGGGVAVDEDAVAVLEAEGQCRACGKRVRGKRFRVRWESEGVRMSLQEDGMAVVRFDGLMWRLQWRCYRSGRFEGRCEIIVNFERERRN